MKNVCWMCGAESCNCGDCSEGPHVLLVAVLGVAVFLVTVIGGVVCYLI